jgi:hypothetical protein
MIPIDRLSGIERLGGVSLYWRESDLSMPFSRNCTLACTRELSKVPLRFSGTIAEGVRSKISVWNAQKLLTAFLLKGEVGVSLMCTVQCTTTDCFRGRR